MGLTHINMLIAAALVSAGVSFGVATQLAPTPPGVASVDTAKLMARFFALAAERDLSGEAQKTAAMRFATALTGAITAVGAEENVLILSAESVVGGVAPDFTDRIAARVFAEARP